MSSVLPTMGSSGKPEKNFDKKMEPNMISIRSSVTNTTNEKLSNLNDDRKNVSPKKLAIAERILKWEQILTPAVNDLHYDQGKGIGKYWKDKNRWNKNKANVKISANPPFFHRDIFSIQSICNRDYSSTGGTEVCRNDGQQMKKIKGNSIAGGKDEEEVQKAGKLEETVCAQRNIRRVETEVEEEAVRRKLAHYPHLQAQTIVASRTDTTSGHCYPNITITTTTITNTTITSSIAVTLPHLSNYRTDIGMSEQYSVEGNNNLIGNDATSDVLDFTVQDTSSSGLSDQNLSLSRLQNTGPEINSIKDKDAQTNHLKRKEGKMKKRKEKEVEKEGITRPLPIQLIRKPSEEGFHQVVKFTKRAARREETEIPESKSPALTEFNEQEKPSSEKEGICAVSGTEDSKNQELDNCTICMRQNLGADIQSQPECRGSADKTCLGHSLNCDTVESKSLSCGSICAESKETHETQPIQKQRDQHKYDGAEICLETGSPQMDEESETFV